MPLHLAKTTWIEVEPLTPDRTKQEKIKRQIVQTTQGTKIKEARPDSFLGEKNQEVDIQTVSRQHTTVMGSSKQAKSEQAKDSVQPVAQPTTLDKLGLAIIPSPKRSVQNQPKNIPNWAEMASSPEDYAKGFKEADHTALNTKEYIFFSYYQRIRERLDRAWVPILREKLYKIYRAGRSLASDMDHSTRVIVVLSPAGEIVRVKIVGESGSMDLDDAAVKAFNEAGPFPNPPRGIIDATGEIQIPWEFILKT